MAVVRGWQGWLHRGVLAGVLVAVAVAPGQAAGAPAAGCAAPHCRAAGTVLWTRPLPGAWAADSDLLGTVPAGPGAGQAYAAAGSALVAVGFAMTVHGYSARTGHPLWTARLAGFPPGSQIVSVRVWPGVVTAGVARGPLLGAAGGGQSTVVLSANGGRPLRSYPSAPFGGAVAATSQDTVVIGPAAVTSYDNATGRAAWSRAIGAAGQDWHSGGGYVYVAVIPAGYLGGGPVTALRRISLATGAEQVVRLAGSPFDGRVAEVLRGVALLSGARGVSAYSVTTGRLLWRRAGAVPQSADEVSGVFYLSIGGTLTGVGAVSGRTVATVPGAGESSSSAVYGVRDGVLLGLDLGPLGQAWGYDVRSQRVIWATGTLPWPHYFAGLYGTAGSAGPAGGTVLLAACPRRTATRSGQSCQDPELVMIDR